MDIKDKSRSVDVVDAMYDHRDIETIFMGQSSTIGIFQHPKNGCVSNWMNAEVKFFHHFSSFTHQKLVSFIHGATLSRSGILYGMDDGILFEWNT